MGRVWFKNYFFCCIFLCNFEGKERNMKTKSQSVVLKVETAYLPIIENFLNTLPYVAIEVAQEQGFTAGNYEQGEKPSSFTAIWKGNSPSLKTIRAKTWKRKK